MIVEKCPKCNKELESPVDICPECGFRDNNTIASVLCALGWIIIIGGIIGSAIIANANPILETKGIYYQRTEEIFNYTLFFAYSFISVISGVLFLGIAEIIKLNQMIFNLMKK